MYGEFSASFQRGNSLKIHCTADLFLSAVKAIPRKLAVITTIGHFLELKAKAQNLTLVNDKTQAQEVYDLSWARKLENLNKLFID